MKALLDACVLYPTVLREILIGAARAGLYTPLWSDRILGEWARAVVKLGPGAELVAQAEIAALKAAFPAAVVAPREGLASRLWLPDPDDVHVLAAAIAGGAAFPRALTRERPEIEARLHLPDPDDLHVLATAIAAGADEIVTFNAADFPRGVLAGEGIAREDPDRFLLGLWQDAPATVAAVVEAVRAEAERLSGEFQPLRPLLRRAKLPRLGKALSP